MSESYKEIIFIYNKLWLWYVGTAAEDPEMDRDELLDQDDYLYFPDHNIPGLSADFWDYNIDKVFDVVYDVVGSIPHIGYTTYI